MKASFPRITAPFNRADQPLLGGYRCRLEELWRGESPSHALEVVQVFQELRCRYVLDPAFVLGTARTIAPCINSHFTRCGAPPGKPTPTSHTL